MPSYPEIRPIADAEGYFISDEGFVYRATSKGIKRVVGTPQCGIPYVTIVKDCKPDPQLIAAWRARNPQKSGHQRRFGNTTNIGIHRLVLDTFRGPCPKGYKPTWADGDRMNCALSNLSWGPLKRATRDVPKRNNRVHRGSKRFFTPDQVIEIRRRVGDGERPSVICVEYNVTKKFLRAVVRGERYSDIPGSFKRDRRGNRIDL